MKSIIEDDHSINDILISTKRGIVTQLDIDNAIEDYKAKLPIPEYLYTKVQTFNGLLWHIRDHVLNTILARNRRPDYMVLDTIFYKIYIPLCSTYGFIPNIILFSNLCNINHDMLSYNRNVLIPSMDDGNTIDNIYNDDDNDELDNNNYSIIAECTKRWYSTCEAALRSQVTDHNSIGSMFMLKAKYQYSDQPQTQLSISIETPKIDEKQLVRLADPGSLPELPDNMP